ncbi:MAG: hypothetical protein ACRYE9_01515 [Janthinobacterium lividum]
MKITKDLLFNLTKRVDEAVDSLMARIDEQEQELIELKNENESLKNNYAQVLLEIEEYVTQLEQIKSNYVYSNHNNKQ